ncbi:MAG: 6-bladed beta-propeller [Bacteroidales bacterium]
MKKTVSFLFFLLIFLLIVIINYSCVRNEGNSTISTTKINVDISNEPIKISSLFSDPELLILEKGEFPLGKLSKVKIYNDTIYILSNFKIFIYDKSGHYISVLNKQGRGPGEYTNIFDFVVDEAGNIDVLDFSGKKIVKYDTKGNYLDNWKTGMYAFSFIKFEDNYIIFGGNGNAATDYSEKMVFVFNKWKGHIIKEFIPVNHNMERFANYVDSRNIQSTNDGFYLGFSPYDTIYHFTNGQLFPDLLIDFGIRKINDQIYSKEFNDILAFNQYLNDKELCHLIYNYLVSPQLVLFNFFYKNSYWAGVYKQNSEEVITSNFFEDDMIFKGNRYKTSNFFPMEYNNGIYYFMMEPYHIANFIKDNGIENVGETNLNQDNLLNIKIEDNPILIKFKFKND